MDKETGRERDIEFVIGKLGKSWRVKGRNRDVVREKQRQRRNTRRKVETLSGNVDGVRWASGEGMYEVALSAGAEKAGIMGIRVL